MKTTRRTFIKSISAGVFGFLVSGFKKEEQPTNQESHPASVQNIQKHFDRLRTLPGLYQPRPTGDDILSKVQSDAAKLMAESLDRVWFGTDETKAGGDRSAVFIRAQIDGEWVNLEEVET